MILRLALLLIGLVALVGSIAIDRPERFAITMPAAVLLTLLAAGAVAADAVPLRRAPLMCSIATLALAPLMFLRAEVHIAVSAGIVALQVLAIAGRLEARREARAAIGAPFPRR